MKLPLLPAVRLLSAAGLCLATASADSVVFEIGAFDNSNADFEQETDTFNNAQYYSEPGDYSLTAGVSGTGTEFTGPGAEILQDGPTAADWLVSNEGFPRALVPGRPVVDVFFQLTAAEAASNALLFETKFFGLGGNSSHDVAFYLNNVAISRILRVRGDTPVKLYIPANLPGMVFQEGANVLTIRRTGGGPVVADGGDSPWIQFDALKLTANVTSPTELIWQVGTFDNSQADFEPEWDTHTNPQFYVMTGDYSAVKGLAGPGGNFPGPAAEIWKDPEGDGSASTEGFPRALTPGRAVVDIYFNLTAAQAQKDFLALHTILFQQGANSSHDVRAYLNGTPVAIGTNIVQDLQVDVLIPRLSAASQGFGPAFHAGANVLSLVRTGGGPVNPEGENSPWIQMDAVSLTTVETPATTSGLQAFRTVFLGGYFNNSVAEFEQESNGYNNPQFYLAPGDYTGTEGGAGHGEVWEGPGAEILQDGPDALSDPENPASPHNWARSLDGFPRSLIVARPVIDLFFQTGTAADAKAYLFTTKLFGPGAGSTHDLEFTINGTSFYTGTGIAGDTHVSAMIPPGEVLPGSNVISLKRTGGVDSGTTWILLDQVELIAQAAAVSLPVNLPAFGLTGVTRNAAGEVSLTWESVAGGIYMVQASASLAVNSWTEVSATPITATGATTSYTDTTVPVGTKVRFYRVMRTQ